MHCSHLLPPLYVLTVTQLAYIGLGCRRQFDIILPYLQYNTCVVAYTHVSSVPIHLLVVLLFIFGSLS